MARTWSSDSQENYCQSADARHIDNGGAGTQILKLNPQTLWLLRVATTVQLAALIYVWPTASTSTALTALIATTALLFTLTLLIRPDTDPTKHQSTQQSINDPTKHRPHSETSLPWEAQQPPLISKQSRRNPTPTRVQIAPLAAPNAALANGLDPKAKAWADLMARMSHDLRTPLNAVIGFSELMQSEAFGPLGSPRYQEYARHIQDCGAALLKSAEDTLVMTSALTDNHGHTNQTLKPIALEPIVSDAWQFTATKANERTIAFHIDIPQNLEIHGERNTLRQILLNLLSEAVNRAQDATQVTLSATTNNDHVELEIAVTKCVDDTTTNTLPQCVARTLLQTHGASLLILNDPQNGWRAITTLDRARQHDFFAQSHAAPENQLQSATTLAKAA